jgi:HK97 gp10 family phage protein
MAGIRWETGEVKHLEFDLTKAPLATQARVGVAVGNTARRMEKDGKRFAPVLTGALRESIHADIHGMEAEIGTDLSYAHFVEFGTGHGPPQPYMGPAFLKNEPKLKEDVADAAGDFL